MTRTKSIELNGELVQNSLLRIKNPLNQYISLQYKYRTLENPEFNALFRKEFCNYYRVRGRSAKWKDEYFDLIRYFRLQEIDFSRCLEYIYERTGRVEASFVSKLIATHDLDQIVVDSIVLGHLDLHLRTTGSPTQKMDTAIEIYAAVTCAFAESIRSQSGRDAINAFRSAYPGAQVTNVKIIDLILWQAR